MKTLEEFGSSALANYRAKQTMEDSILFNSAMFSHAPRGYEVEVRGHVVMQSRDFAAVRAFVESHNQHLADSR